MAFLGERKLANFRVRGAKKPHKNSENFKRRPGMSEEHLALIRHLPCCLPQCRRKAPSDPHHLKSDTGGERGTGMKATDKWAVPLCRVDHDIIEGVGTRNEAKWFLDKGIDAHRLALDLWGATGDLPRLQRVLAAHWENMP